MNVRRTSFVLRNNCLVEVGTGNINMKKRFVWLYEQGADAIVIGQFSLRKRSLYVVVLTLVTD